MPNPFGWGQNEPQIKPKDQGGDTIATFSQKIYNLFDTLFDTLNSYPWSTATQSDAGYMSASDKTALDSVKDKAYVVISGELISLPNDTRTNLTSYTFAKTGIYIVNYVAIYRTSSVGLRTTNISSTSAGDSIDATAVTVVPAVSTGYTFCPIVRIEKITTANTTRYLNGRQTAGGNLSCTGYIYVARLGDA